MSHASSVLVTVAALWSGMASVVAFANSEQAPPLLVDIENLQISQAEQKAISLQAFAKAEKLEASNELKKAKQTVLSFLRCEEPDHLNQFNQPDNKTLTNAFGVLADINQSVPLHTADAVPEMFQLRVWQGLVGQVHLDADYGFFSVLQYYQPDQKTALFREIKSAGWKDTGTRTTGEENKLFPNMTFRIFEKPEQKGRVVRKLHMIEEQMFVDLKFPRRPGLTLSCISTVKEK